MSGPLLEIEGLEVAYGEIRALRGVSLTVSDGEGVALVGANGAGKSTLLRSVVGHLAPRAGDIRFAGRSLAGASPDRRVRAGLGYSPEGRRVFPAMSVAENLELACWANTAERGRRLRRLFELFPVLAERAGMPAGQLSGGEQQMLAIGRALIGEPRLLLLDEPSLGLSPVLANDLFLQIRRIIADGIAVLLAEQNVARALGICDRAYVLQVGRVVAEGTAARLRDSEEIRKAYLGGG